MRRRVAVARSDHTHSMPRAARSMRARYSMAAAWEACISPPQPPHPDDPRWPSRTPAAPLIARNPVRGEVPCLDRMRLRSARTLDRGALRLSAPPRAPRVSRFAISACRCLARATPLRRRCARPTCRRHAFLWPSVRSPQSRTSEQVPEFGDATGAATGGCHIGPEPIASRMRHRRGASNQNVLIL